MSSEPMAIITADNTVDWQAAASNRWDTRASPTAVITDAELMATLHCVLSRSPGPPTPVIANLVGH